MDIEGHGKAQGLFTQSYDVTRYVAYANH